MSSIKSLYHIPFEKWTSPWRENRGNFSKILWPIDIFLIITLSLLLNLVSEKLFIPFKSMVFHWLQSGVTMRVWPRPLLPLEDILTLWLQRFSVWHCHSGPLHTGNSSLLYHFSYMMRRSFSDLWLRLPYLRAPWQGIIMGSISFILLSEPEGGYAFYFCRADS